MAGGALGEDPGGTAGHRVGRGRGCRSGVVERHAVEPVLLRWGPLNGTTIRYVPAPCGVTTSVAPVGAATPLFVGFDL